MALTRDAGAASRGDVQVTAGLDISSVGVGEEVNLQVEVSYELRSADVGSPLVRAPKGIEVVEAGASTSSWTVRQGGRVTTRRTQTHNYSIFANKPGRHTLDVRVPIDGRRVRAQGDLVLDVTPGSKRAGSESEQGRGRDQGGAAKEVFIRTAFDRESVYVGQQVIYTFDVWERTDAQLSLSEAPTFKDFWSEELPTDSARRDRAHGMDYRVRPVTRRALFPHTAGQIVAEGGEITVSPDSISMFFGMGRRRRQRKRAYRVSAPPARLTVKPLPAKGQPPGFPANNVGRYRIFASSDRQKLKVGEALTLHIDIRGEGNVRLVEPSPWPDLPGFRRYDPKQEAPELEPVDGKIRGRRRYSFLLIAEQAGRLEIPAHALAFFDPIAEKYEKVTTDPLFIRVLEGTGANSASAKVPDPSPAAGANPGAVDSASPAQGANAQTGVVDGATASGLEADPLARPLTDSAVDRVDLQSPWLSFEGWLGGLLAAPAALGIAAGVQRIRAAWAPDDRTRARLDRVAANADLLAKAKAVGVDDERKFCAMVAELLQTNAVYAAGDDGVGLTREKLMARMRRAGLSDEVAAEFRTLADACDAARFGAPSAEFAHREALLVRCQRVVTAMVEVGGRT